MPRNTETPDDLRAFMLARTIIVPAPYGLVQPCRLWQGRIKDGYGHIQRFGKDLRVHRVAFVLWVGPVPEGLDVLHRCDQRPCIEPTHLWVGTRADNVADCLAKGRHGYGREQLHQPGVLHRAARLTEDQVRQIRAVPAGGPWRALARQFGVSADHARDIRQRRSWRHLI